MTRTRVRFEEAAAHAGSVLDSATLRALAVRISHEWPDHAILADIHHESTETVRTLLVARQQSGIAEEEAAAFLRGLAIGHDQRADAVRVESVWSGPESHSVPVRASAQVLVDLVTEATRELFLMTYSATPHEPLWQALTDALQRGVSVTVIVETLQGAGSALSGSEPAAAFASIPGIQLWHWPTHQRHDRGAKMHAKLAVADRRTLLVSSANLTQSGVGKNIEAGLLVRGGTTPLRVAEHLSTLKATGVLDHLAVTPYGKRG